MPEDNPVQDAMDAAMSKAIRLLFANPEITVEQFTREMIGEENA